MVRPTKASNNMPASGPTESGQRGVLDYQRAGDQEIRSGFWPDREGWKDLIAAFVGELIVMPLLILAVIWICSWFL